MCTSLPVPFPDPGVVPAELCGNPWGGACWRLASIAVLCDLLSGIGAHGVKGASVCRVFLATLTVAHAMISVTHVAA